ncbi:IclR family transcriptional regulator [Saccharopolyspora sp. K220]|uniref:IclR family transcriptional regulator n=1 Tax=Saccharopolyspora soli TaxID=2926618 RepID=UPI001F58EE25|nr:IclR family transcriptional regulator [Saccharopolyspora soli]MCI2417871.1 IclR family transcriptional regulator [Saccharopolyspora soli]
MTRDGAGLSMVEKSWMVLDAFAPGGGPMRLTELADRAGLPRSTVHRLLTRLVEVGSVERSADGFHLGRKLFELGAMVPVERGLRNAALPFMEDLYIATHEAVHMGVMDGYDVVYVEKIYGHAVFSMPSRVGGRLPLTCTAIGKAMLAFAEPEFVEAVLAQPLRRLTRHSVVDPGRLADALAEIQVSGIAYEYEEVQAGGGSLAAPVFEQGKVVAALSVAVPVARFHPVRLAPAVKTAALGLSRQLSRSTRPAGGR